MATAFDPPSLWLTVHTLLLYHLHHSRAFQSFNTPETFDSVSVYPCDDIDLLLFAPEVSDAYRYCICPPELEELLIQQPQRWCLKVATSGRQPSQRMIDSMHGFTAYIDFSFKSLTPGPFSNGTCSLRYEAYAYSYQLAPIFPVRYNCTLEFTAFKQTLLNVTDAPVGYYSISSPCCPVRRVPYYLYDLSSCVLQENQWYALQASSETITRRYKFSKYEWKTVRQWWVFKTSQFGLTSGSTFGSQTLGQLNSFGLGTNNLGLGITNSLRISVADTESCKDFVFQGERFETDENGTMVTSIISASLLEPEYHIRLPEITSLDYLNHTQLLPVIKRFQSDASSENIDTLPSNFCWLVTPDPNQQGEPKVELNCDFDSCYVEPIIPAVVVRSTETLPQKITFGIFALIIIFLIISLCYRCLLGQ